MASPTASPSRHPRARSVVGASGISPRDVGDRPAGQDVLFLLAGFDSTGPNPTDGANCLGGIHSELDEQPRRDRPGAAETAATVHEHPAAAPKNPAQIGAGGNPPGLEPLIGNGNIDNRQVNPSHSVLLDHGWQIDDVEHLELAGLDQRDNYLRSPVAHNADINFEVAIPSAIAILLARTEGQADAPGDTWCRHCSDCQRTTQAALHKDPSSRQNILPDIISRTFPWYNGDEEVMKLSEVIA